MPTRNNPFAPKPDLPSSAAKTPLRKWQEEIAETERYLVNCDAGNFHKSIRKAAKIDLALTMAKAAEYLERLKESTLPSNDLMCWQVANFIVDRIAPLHQDQPETAEAMFWAVNNYAGSGSLRARLNKVAPQIGLGPKG